MVQQSLLLFRFNLQQLIVDVCLGEVTFGKQHGPYSPEQLPTMQPGSMLQVSFMLKGYLIKINN